jgi:hypothetical protein
MSNRIVRTPRIAPDLALVIFLLCANAYRIIGDAAHEWVVVSVSALFITHNIINRRRYKTILSDFIFRRNAVGYGDLCFHCALRA